MIFKSTATLSVTAAPGVPDAIREGLASCLPGHSDLEAFFGERAAHEIAAHIALGDDSPGVDPLSGKLVIPLAHAERVVAVNQLTPLLGGLTVLPTLYHYVLRGLVPVLQPQGSWVGLPELATGLGLADPTPNLGNLYGSLRLLALQGWLHMRGVDEKTSFSLSPEGLVAAELVSKMTDVVGRCVANFAHAKDYPYTFRKKETDVSVLAEYRALVSRMLNGWELPLTTAESEGRIGAQLAKFLDGALVCPTLVAFAMPEFKLIADRREVTAPSLFSLFDARTHTLQLKNAAQHFNLSFVREGLRLLQGFGLLEKNAQAEEATLNETGLRYTQVAAIPAMPMSYMRSYARLPDYLFGDPDPLQIDTDQHVDRIMNIFGASVGGSVFLARELAHSIVRSMFDERPLDQQPAGVADIGCGDGLALKYLAEYVIGHTKRGRSLDRYPLSFIGADYFDGPRQRALAVLKPLEATPGVRVEVIKADVGRPDVYDETLRALKLPYRDASGSLSSVSASALLHTLMFLSHDRTLQISEPAVAREVLRRSVEQCDRTALLQALALLGVTQKATDVDELTELVEGQLQTSFAGKNGLVPAVVAAGDLLTFFQRWRPYLQSGIVIMESHDARPQRMEGAVLAAIDKLPFHGTQWAMHYISRQFQLPYLEHRLLLTLAGLTPLNGEVHGGWYHWNIPSLDRLDALRNISMGAFQAGPWVSGPASTAKT